MNAILKNINQPPLRAPKSYASCDQVGKEVMISEDLRPSGYVMYDKMKGLDLNHATFVMEELGRLHAISLLYEKKFNSTIGEMYTPFNVSSL